MDGGGGGQRERERERGHRGGERRGDIQRYFMLT
jgi:hypothetical protein